MYFFDFKLARTSSKGPLDDRNGFVRSVRRGLATSLPIGAKAPKRPLEALSGQFDFDRWISSSSKVVPRAAFFQRYKNPLDDRNGFVRSVRRGRHLEALSGQFDFDKWISSSSKVVPRAASKVDPTAALSRRYQNPLDDRNGFVGSVRRGANNLWTFIEDVRRRRL